jgi:hypothetical protein
VEEYVQPEHEKDQSEQNPRDNGGDFHSFIAFCVSI